MVGVISLDRRRFIRLGSLAMGAAALGALPQMAGAAGTRPVDFQLGWIVDYNQTGEIVAQKLGYFAEEGLELVIQPGGSNIDGVALVASGQFPVGQSTSSPSLMLAASQKLPVVAFAVGAQRHPFAFFSLPKSPIRTPKDMIGKKIGIQSTSQVLLSALLKKNGIDESSVEVVPVGYDMVPLTSGQVDAISGWVIDVGVLKALGPDLITMTLWDSGIKLYSDVYYSTKEVLEKQPEILVGFLKAVARGWHYARAHPDEAVAALVEANPNMAAGEAGDGLQALLKFEFTDETKVEGWGTMDPKVWQAQIDTYADIGQFTAGTPALADVMTTSILDQTKDFRLKLT